MHVQLENAAKKNELNNNKSKIMRMVTKQFTEHVFCFSFFSSTKSALTICNANRVLDTEKNVFKKHTKVKQTNTQTHKQKLEHPKKLNVNE